MKKAILSLILLLPLLLIAQYSQDYLRKPEDNGNLYIALASIYVLICLVVCITCGYRGWDSLSVFFAAFFATPLIAAILYAPYKRIEKKISESPENPATVDQNPPN